MFLHVEIFGSIVGHCIEAKTFNPNLRTIWLLFGWCESEKNDMNIPTQDTTNMYTVLIQISTEQQVRQPSTLFSSVVLRATFLAAGSSLKTSDEFGNASLDT